MPLVASLASSAGDRVAQSVALRALDEPDALPVPALAERAEAWRPWRSYGCMYVGAEKAG